MGQGAWHPGLGGLHPLFSGQRQKGTLSSDLVRQFPHAALRRKAGIYRVQKNRGAAPCKRGSL